ncbi:MAG: LysR family transcriptional regulator, partial [Rhizobiales bacterium]|nr:LysR family transcriptional regulator [Hyphomicrobiales bacterium]
MTTPYLKLVHRFVTVVEQKSIHRAAKKLNISQPSLSQSIKNIESYYECLLLERTKRGVFLTEPGKRLYKHSCKILELGSFMHQEITDLISGRTGKLRISAGTAWGNCY